MIDIKRLREEPEAFKESARLRGLKVDVDAALRIDADRLKTIGRVEELRSKLNVKGKPTSEQLDELQKQKSELEPLERKLTTIETALNVALSEIPNLLADGTPKGGEEANREEKTWGEGRK